ncbi:hypothetical protein N7457_007752 [Penicillium paradoxum]|uniref:uncharacterized protein n=1 Tax=Penicillium paradoxum TaxID=176176 RepID=UPI002549005A|nr:uncharacterized protein N7457_007752 [Penicillium paradoxum]KAJ5772856.1 hypothetical protein N7457_007752 [Penicillium paradoxum]
MASTNFNFQDIPEPVVFILLALWLSSFAIAISRYIVEVSRAAIIYHVLRFLYRCYHERTATKFVAEILSTPLNLPNFVLLAGILFLLHSLTQELEDNFLKKDSPPRTIVDCSDCPMQSPQISQDFEMPRVLPLRWPKTTKPITHDKPRHQPQPASPKISQPDKNSFTSHLNQYLRHPWGVIDYFIYLAHIESGRDKCRRAKECYLLETQGFRQITLHDNPSFEDVSPHTNATVFFATLPVPNEKNEFTNAKLVLAFDLETRCFQGYLFEHTSSLENYDDLWEAWNCHEGQLVINVQVDRFLATLRHTMERQIEILEIGILHHNGMTSRPFPAGLDMVIDIQFLQFVDDFADLLWVEPEEVRELYAPFQDELRELLSSGSRDSWFAARDGLGIEQYRQKQLKKVVTSGLFYGQNVAALRTGAEEKCVNKKLGSASRLVKIIPGHSELWSKKQIQVFVSAMLVLCLCSWIGRGGFLTDDLLLDELV